MQKKTIIAGISLLLLSSVILAGCGAGSEQVPTPDIGAIKTEAVQTAVAQLTVDAAMHPSATSIPPTMTLLPTATQVTPVPTKKVYYSGSSGSSGGSSKTPIPTLTPDAWKCEIIDEYPYDTEQMTGWEYDRHWVIKNIGTTTWWANDVYIQFDEENCPTCINITGRDKFFINANVEPGETIDISMDMDVPTQPKEFPGYTMAWDMISGNGGLICEFWNNIPSTYPAPTKTP
jgi:hypothetical protein